MRWPLLFTLGLAATTPSLAAPGGGDPDQPALTAQELERYFAPYIPGVKTCYAAAQGPAATGALRLELIIHRDGSVVQFGFSATGITGARLGKLDGCLRTLSATWHFPVRAGFTSAVIPFHFQRTDVPRTVPGARA